MSAFSAIKTCPECSSISLKQFGFLLLTNGHGSNKLQELDA